MLLDFSHLSKKYNFNIKGILHIGAHIGQEFSNYRKENLTNIVFFEPLVNNFERLKYNVGEHDDVLFIKKALGNKTGKGVMKVETANGGQSSSLLDPVKHLTQYPHILFDKEEEVEIERLDDLLPKIITLPKLYNFINIDVQGYELEVFKGAEKQLNNIDYIMTEVNRDEVFKNCCRVEQLDEYLNNWNFKRVETTWDGGTWGDALYIKE